MSVETVTIEYQISIGDYDRYILLGHRMAAPRHFGLVWWCAGAVAPIRLGQDIYHYHAISTDAIVQVLLYALLCVVAWLSLRHAPVNRFFARRRYPQYKKHYGAAQASFSTHEITFAWPVATSTVKWTAYDRYLLDDQILALVMPSNLAHVLPRRAFDSEGWAVVEGWVKEKLKLGLSK